MLRNGGERHMGADSHAAVVFWPTWRRDACAPTSAGFSDDVRKMSPLVCLDGQCAVPDRLRGTREQQALAPTRRRARLRALRAVLRAALASLVYALAVERAAHDVIAHARQILHAATANQHH
jgi:hypothetical protein